MGVAVIAPIFSFPSWLAAASQRARPAWRRWRDREPEQQQDPRHAKEQADDVASRDPESARAA